MNTARGMQKHKSSMSSNHHHQSDRGLQNQYQDQHLLMQSQSNQSANNTLQIKKTNIIKRKDSNLQTKDKMPSIIKKQPTNIPTKQPSSKTQVGFRISTNTKKTPNILELLQKHEKNGKQNCAVKAYNYLENSNTESLQIVDSPEVVNYILEVIEECRIMENNQNHSSSMTNGHFSSAVKTSRQSSRNNENISKQLASCGNSPRRNHKRESNRLPPSHRFNEEHYLNKLEKWLKGKLNKEKCHRGNEITERLHTLHLGFTEVFRETSKYSNQLSELLAYIHYEYHTFYQQLISNMMYHNKQLKKQVDKTQSNLNQTIIRYQKQIYNMRTNFDKKSAQVIENFHHCINLKNVFEKDAKKYSKALSEEKNKIKYMEECLTKAIQMLIEIGNQKFSFLTQEQESAIMELSGSFKLCPEDCKLFYRWCATIVRNITNLKQSKTAPSEEKKISEFALSQIAKFMIDVDPNLSVQDVKNILNGYVPNYTPNIIKISTSQSDLNNFEEKPIKIKKVPDLYEIRETMKGNDIQIQTNMNWEYENKAIQSVIESEDAAIMAKPRCQQKQTCTVIWIKQKMKICTREIYDFIWGEREMNSSSMVIRVKPNKNVNNQMIKVSLTSPSASPTSNNNISNQNRKRSDKQQKKSNLKKPSPHGRISSKTNKSIQNNQLITLKTDDFIHDDTPIPSSEVIEVEQSEHRDRFDSQISELETVTRSRKNRRVGFVQTYSQGNRNKILQKSQQQEYKSSRELVRSKTIKGITESDPPQTQLNQGGKQLLAQSLQHRKKLLQSDVDKFVQSITKMRSMKKLKVNGKKSDQLNDFKSNSHSYHEKAKDEQQRVASQKSEYPTKKKQEPLFINLIKIPRKLLMKSNFQKCVGNTISFRVQVLERLQQRNQIITESVMWSEKRCIEIQKICNRLKNTRQKPPSSNYYHNKVNRLQTLKSLIKFQLNPIIEIYVRMYSQLVTVENMVGSPEYKKHLLLAKKIPYYHRLAPLLYSLINVISTNFNLKNANNLLTASNKHYQKQLTKIYNEIKSLRKNEKSPIIQIYEQLLDSQETELDVFIKIMTHLEPTKNSYCKEDNNEINEILEDLQNATIYLNVAEVQLFFILNDYFTASEINGLITEVRTIKKERDIRRSETDSEASICFDEKIQLTKLILKIFKALKTKKNTLKKRYKGVIQLIGINNEQSITFNDLLQLLEVLPIEKSTKNKIIFQSTFYTIYWDKKQASIPYDRVLFLFDSAKFLHKSPIDLPKKGKEAVDEASYSVILLEYFQLKIEEDESMKYIHDVLLQNFDYITQLIYKLFFRVPPLIYRLTEQLKASGFNKMQGKRSSVMLVIFYRRILLQQIEKIYHSSALSLLQSISYIANP